MDLSGLRVLDGFWLKRIAIASMVIDHIGSFVMDGVLAPYMGENGVFLTADMPFFVRYAPMIKSICSALGSVAFPLFCLLLTEGFLHSRNPLRYGGRLGAFALLSEAPFDIAHRQVPVYWGLQNVLFTLCVGLFTLYFIKKAEAAFAGKPPLKILSVALIALAGAGLAYLIRSEYVFLGIGTVVLLYLLRGNRWLQLLGFGPLLVASPFILLAVPCAAAYNGQRGKGLQWFFYGFYPAHFLLLAGLAELLARR